MYMYIYICLYIYTIYSTLEMKHTQDTDTITHPFASGVYTPRNAHTYHTTNTYTCSRTRACTRTRTGESKFEAKRKRRGDIFVLRHS